MLAFDNRGIGGSEMARRMPNAEVHIVPHTLHGVMSERPDTFELVLDFLRRN